MIKLIVFDLDNTLAKLSKGIIPEDIKRLKEIEQCGVKIAICSGKPTYYLCGFMRQIELEDPILVGENGAVIQFGVDLPPKRFYKLPYSEEARKSIDFLKRSFEEAIPDMWYQPNLVGLTPFPKTEEEFAILEILMKKHEKEMKDLAVYRHVDSFDITPAGIDKMSGLRYLGELLNAVPEEMIAVGDGVNDYPMFEYAGYSIGVNVKDADKVNKNFASSTEALKYIQEEILL